MTDEQLREAVKWIEGLSLCWTEGTPPEKVPEDMTAVLDLLKQYLAVSGALPSYQDCDEIGYSDIGYNVCRQECILALMKKMEKLLEIIHEHSPMIYDEDERELAQAIKKYLLEEK